MVDNNTDVFKVFVADDRLDGNNYPMWAYMMQHVLVSKSIWNIVKGIDVRLGSEDLPLYAVVVLGCYGLAMVGYGLIVFPTCPQEAVLLQKDIAEAKEFLQRNKLDVFRS
ncbi:hypothetical protein L7F22_018390 [Adiantum nelumboides]|nr:hypothetical protein [Adiantum nelumboides]